MSALQREHEVPLQPAPWQLQGWGLMMLWFSRSAREAARASLTREQAENYAGGPVMAMLVRYAQSDCGPYDELLYIPGRFYTPEGPRAMISRIWVSTNDSVVNGRINWAIPKELAEFDFSGETDDQSTARGDQTATVTVGGQSLKLDFRPATPAIPVTTSLLPARWRTLVQPTLPEQRRDESRCYTTVSATSRLCLARLESLTNAGLLPLPGSRPTLTTLASGVKMQFPPCRFG